MADTRSIVGETFRRLGEWDADRVGEMFADEIDWFVPTAPGLPWGGRRTRGEEVAEYFSTLWAHLHTEQSRVQIDQVVVEGEDAVALGTFSHVAKTTGLRFTTPVAMRLSVRNGLVTRLHLYEDTYAVAKAFGVVTDAASS
jgi:hypothetical protein